MKKDLTDGLLQLAIVLSLLRTDLHNLNNYLNNYGNYPEIQEIIMGPTSAYTQTNIHNTNWHNGIGFSHPKNIDSYYSSSVFQELHSLAHYNDYNNYEVQGINTQISAWLISGPAPAFPNEVSEDNSQDDREEISQTSNQVANVHVEEELSHANGQGDQAEGPLISPDLPIPANIFFQDEQATFSHGSELTKEDVDLIEILWRQDMDLGIGREMFDQTLRREKEKEKELQKQKEKEKELKSTVTSDQTQIPDTPKQENVTYVVDGETGELVPVPPGSEVTVTPIPSANLVSDLDELSDEGISIDEAMRLLEQQEAGITASSSTTSSSSSDQEVPSTQAPPGELVLNQAQLEQEIEAMIQNAEQFNQQLPHLNFDRQDSFDRRWQDVVDMLNLPDNETGVSDLNQNGSLPNPSNALLNNATLPINPQPDATNITFNNMDMGNGFLPNINQSLPSSFPANSTMTNDTNPGIFDFENLFPDITNPDHTFIEELMDADPVVGIDYNNISVSQNLQSARTVMDDASSDSAVSMGSSSPSQDLNDTQSDFSESCQYEGLEGATGGSDFGETKYNAPKYEKFGDFHYGDYSYGGSSSGGDNNMHVNNSGDDPANEASYNSMGNPRHVRHNHTYPLQPGQQPRESASSKKEPKSVMFSRDQKKIKQMKIPFSAEMIINSPVEEFNELLAKYQLNDAQLQLIRDIRRRGKNKVAAQNCRKRKMEVISDLEEDVEQLRHEKEKLMKERKDMDKEKATMRDQLALLYREVFASLRDDQGRPYDPNEYSLQHTEDGNVFLVPSNSTTRRDPDTTNTKKKKGGKKGN